jgi:2-succinyl-5-enolpyruvyl-6-hydroxy-3-cyclohexene-1-carboxylate synthase
VTGDANAACARCLVDEWSRAGVSAAVVSPGSRSSPLALALAEHGGIEVHVHLDERSASFFALGLAKATGRPAVTLCTSGTAAANFHPAVLEASHARVPLIVCTADRPPELREVGEAQTVDQGRMYGTAVRWYFEPEAPRVEGVGPADPSVWRWLGARAAAEAMGPPAGPVHLNLPFREPLVPTGRARPPFGLGGRPGDRPWTSRPHTPRLFSDETAAALAARISATPRGIVAAGWGASAAPSTVGQFARTAGWPVLADPLSGLRTGPLAVTTYDALARIASVRDALRPELVVRLGAPLTSKAAMSFLGGCPAVLVDPQRSWSDPLRAAEEVLEVEPGPLLDALASLLAPGRGDSPWLAAWADVETTARAAIDGVLDGWSEPFEGRVARDLLACLPDGAALVVASSMPVRDLETFARARGGVTVLANRGVNGIDGFVSTALGVAASRTWLVTVGLLGDLCLLHDANGLLGAGRRGIDAVLVVVDNDGGGIFSFLPQADLPAHFEELFATPHQVDLSALGLFHGLPVTDVRRADELVPAVEEALARGGIRILRVRTERRDNVERHRAVFQAVADALGG